MKRRIRSVDTVVGIGAATYLYLVAAAFSHAHAVSLTGQSLPAVAGGFQTTGQSPLQPDPVRSDAPVREPAATRNRDYVASTDLILGGSELAALIKDKGQGQFNELAQEFAFDTSTFGEWYQFSSDLGLGMELDELLDFRAIAVATYNPEIRFWLEGNRWAEFGSNLPTFNSAGIDDKKKAGGAPGSQTAYSGGAAQVSGNPFAAKRQSDGDPNRVLSLSDFFTGMFFKLIKLPITYVILAVCMGAVLFSLRHQPRS
jgi:hypothetical protein